MRKKKKRISIESYKSFLNNFKKKRGCTKLVLELKLKKYIYIYNTSIDRALLPGIKRRGSLVTQLEGWTLNRCARTFRFCSRSPLPPDLLHPPEISFRALFTRLKVGRICGGRRRGLFPDDALQRIRRKSLNETAT